MYVKTQIRPFLKCLQLLLLVLLPASSCSWLLLATASGDYVAVAAAADDDNEWQLCLGQGKQVKSATAHRKSEVLACRTGRKRKPPIRASAQGGEAESLAG